jgi:NAD(P) transhydrogenase
METNEYDLVVIGSGPAGQKGAICAAKLRKRVAIVDRKRTIGGVCVHTGTIPSKTLRQSVFTGLASGSVPSTAEAMC